MNKNIHNIINKYITYSNYNLNKLLEINHHIRNQVEYKILLKLYRLDMEEYG